MTVSDFQIEFTTAAFAFIDVFLLSLLLAWESLLVISNRFGIAWWAKVETHGPNVTYWFGPFLTRKVLKGDLEYFLEDLAFENPEFVSHTLIQRRCNGRLTICSTKKEDYSELAGNESLKKMSTASNKNSGNNNYSKKS